MRDDEGQMTRYNRICRKMGQYSHKISLVFFFEKLMIPHQHLGIWVPYFQTNPYDDSLFFEAVFSSDGFEESWLLDGDFIHSPYLFRYQLAKT